MFFNADDDEQDFVSPGGSKLANLFGMDKATGQSGNSSLTYTAPKQPKKKDPGPEGNAAPTVVTASVVHAYKYVDNKYASQGKLGIALLLTPATKDYRILLYLNQQQQVTNAKITSRFSFNIQQNNYASFYDDARQTWSVMFESSDSCEKFAKEVALAKANSGPLTELVQQDLILGEGGALESGDSAEVKYTGWLLVGGTLGKVFDQSPADNFRLKIGKGKVIKGWDQGMMGMKKGGKRLLIIPPALAYGSQGVSDRVPPNATLIFEVHVARVKLQKGDVSPQSSPAPTPGPSLNSVALQDQDDMEDTGIKGRSRSINEQFSNSPDSDKAKLISRMARMGQPMLPFQGAIPAQPEDSDEDLQHQVQSNVTAGSRPPLASKPRSSSGLGSLGNPGQVVYTQTQAGVMNPGFTMVGNQPMVVNSAELLQQQQPAFLQNLPGAQQLAVYQNPNNNFLQQQQATMLQQQQLIQQQQQLLSQGLSSSQVTGVPGQSSAFGVPVTPAPPNTSSSSADALAPVLLTETRQQNTEVRIGISKMSDKVDKILEKVDQLTAASLGMHAMGMVAPYGGNLPAPSMEANVLMQNISRIVQENERLKKEAYDQSNKVQELNDRISSLLERNQKYVEQSQNLIEQRNEGYKASASQSQSRVLTLEQEKVQLATDLSTASAQITNLQLELGEFRKREGELRQQLQSSSTVSSTTKEELDRLKLQREEDEQKINSMTNSLRDEKLARKSLESKLASFQEELSETKVAKDVLEKSLSERKRKAAEERRKLEEDLEDAKINYEKTIEDLREKLRRQKSSVDATAQSKISKIEEEISTEWQAKSERMLAAATEKFNRQLADVKDEKEELIRKIEELEKKLHSVRSSGSSTEQQVSQLQDELAEMRLWKDKYENIRTQATTMKERYEKRIRELEGEKEDEEDRRNEILEQAKEQRQELQQRVQQLQQEVQQLRTELATAREEPVKSSIPPPSVGTGPDVATEVKKIMNSVFQTLRAEFDSNESYQGSEVLTTILNVIKQTTLKLVNQAPGQTDTKKDDEEEYEEEEDEEEDEEVEEEDEDEEDVVAEEEIETTKAVEVVEIDVKSEPVFPVLTSNDNNAIVTEREEPEAAASSRETKEVIQNPDISQTQVLLQSVDKHSDNPPTVPEPSSDSSSIHLPPLDNSTDDRVFDVVDNPQSKEKVETDSGEDLDENFANITQTHSDKLEQPNIFVIERESDNINESEDEEPAANKKQDNFVREQNGLESPQVKNTSQATSVPREDDTFSNGEDLFPVAEVGVQKETVEPKQVDDSEVKEGADVNTNKTLNFSSSDSREPPPLFDDDDGDDDFLFGNEKSSEKVESAFKPTKPANAESVANNKTVLPQTKDKDKVPPGKKVDQLINDEDLKPQPPPPLFGDDSDEDDLDWLN